ncbi:hypothetical protein AB1N83_007429 [Pleurotus pulmonarius]
MSSLQFNSPFLSMNRPPTRRRLTWGQGAWKIVFLDVLFLWLAHLDVIGAVGVCRLKARALQSPSTPPSASTSTLTSTTDRGFGSATPASSTAITTRTSSAATALTPLPSVVNDTPNESIDVNTLPTQCRSRCSPLTDAINSCTGSSTTCSCTRANQDNVVGCLECMVLLAPGVVEVLQQAQRSVDELERSCSDAGVSLPHRAVIDSSTNRLLLLQRDALLFPQHPNVSLSWLD